MQNVSCNSMMFICMLTLRLHTRALCCTGIISQLLPRGRYSVGLYRQMGHGDWVARDPAVFVRLAVRLAQDDEFQLQQSQAIALKYQDMHRNHFAAAEWLHFLDRAIKQQQ